MRNLIAFFKRFQIFLVFFLLQVIALSSYFSFLSYPRSKYFNTSSSIAATVLEMKHSITKYADVDESNAALQLENIALRTRQPDQYIRVDANTVSIDDTIYKQNYQYIPGEILHATTEKTNNYFTINIGRSLGVEPGQGVYGPIGILGRVYDVSDNYALVKSVLSKELNINIQVENNGAHGYLKWDGNDPRIVTLSGISNDIDIRKRAKITTRGSRGIFPKGIPVGTVDKVEQIEGKPLWKVHVRLNEDLRTVQKIYVVKNVMKKELDALEAKIPNEE